MNKQETIQAINNIPLFVMRDVALGNTYQEKDKIRISQPTTEWVEDFSNKAITEENSNEPLAYTSKRYAMVQMREMFTPIAEKVEDFDGHVTYYHGFGIMEVYPTQAEYNADGYSVGIVAYNSVDLSCALNIKFCVKQGKRRITMPKKVAGFRKVHLGDVKEMTQDYIAILTKVKDAWSNIVTKFTEQTVNIENVEEIGKAFKLDERTIKTMKKGLMEGQIMNLWDFCMDVIDYISSRKFKSEIHKRKRIDKFVETLFGYEMALAL